MRKIFIALLILIPFVGISQAVVKGLNGLIQVKDTVGLGGGGGSLVKGYIDITKPPYSMVNGQDISVNLKNILDSLHTLYNSGTVYIPGNFNFGRPVVGSQKGVRLWANQHIIGNGGRITFTNDCAFANTDFGTDSLGTVVTADCVDSTTYFTVASTTNLFVGDTVYIRLATAPYDAGEPVTFGYRKITRIADATHMQLDAPGGGAMTVASTSTLNRRIIRIHNLTVNASVENVELFNPGTGSAYMEAGVYVQGGINITVDRVRASNPALGLACFQFCRGCLLTNSILDSSSNLGNANAGRGVTVNECEECGFVNNVFNKYQRSAFINESNNINSYGVGNTFNNNWSDSIRVAITTLGSGTFKMDNTTFTGFQHTAYDFVLSTGNLVITNTVATKGTPFKMYEQQGITILPPLVLADGSYYVKKQFTYRFNMPVNGTYTWDSLPKGIVTSASVTLDDTTGCTSFFWRRDNTNTNNGSDFFSQLRSGKAIYPSIGASWQVGNNLPTANLNYNEDKSFSVTTNSTALAGKTGTVTIFYLEKSGSALLNRFNSTTSYSNATTGTGVAVLKDSPAFAGAPTTPTPTNYTNTTQVVNAAFTQQELMYRKYAASGDADYTVATQVYFVELTNPITSNRVLTLPSAGSNAGRELKVYNRNVGSSLWSFAANVTTPTGIAVTTMANGTWYILYCDGTNWIIQNSGIVAYTSKTTTYSITSADYTIDCSGTFTVTLPTAASATGKEYLIKNSGTGTVTIATTSSQTIDGVTTKTLNVQYGGLKVQSNGSNYIVVGSF